LEGPDLRVDVREFQQALAEGDAARALEACDARILNDFEEEWAIEARDEHAQQLAGAARDGCGRRVRSTSGGGTADPRRGRP
jgi:hypothetical protein